MGLWAVGRERHDCIPTVNFPIKPEVWACEVSLLEEFGEGGWKEWAGSSQGWSWWVLIGGLRGSSDILGMLSSTSNT